MEQLVKRTSVIGDALAFVVVGALGAFAWQHQAFRGPYVAVAVFYVWSLTPFWRARALRRVESRFAGVSLPDSPAPGARYWLMLALVSVTCFIPAYVMLAEVWLDVPLAVLATSAALFAAGAVAAIIWKNNYSDFKI